MIILPYLLCGINSAIIVTRLKTGKDIRTMGSGNAGLTNTYRTQGKAAALFVLLGDVAKGVLSVIIVWLCFKYLVEIDARNASEGYEWALYASGVSAILGHVFPIYYGFKGGKGVLVTVAVLLAINWVPAVILLGIFAVIVAATRYVSLGSCIAAALYPVAVLIFGLIEHNPSVVANTVLSAVIGGLIIFMHHDNTKDLESRYIRKGAFLWQT